MPTLQQASRSRRGNRLRATVLLGALLMAPSALGAIACLECHPDANRGLIAGHRFADRPCARCHRGDGSAPDLAGAHAGLIAFPGELSNAAETCGDCHAAQVAGVIASDMHTGAGMVAITREVLGAAADPTAGSALQRLGDGVADSLLRKLCASCHLGQPKEAHRLDPVHDRGGGCLACHINAYPPDAHPMLSTRVEDGRCFGCHSRSGRISLNYPGLAEAPSTAAVPRQDGPPVSRLPDGRIVERRPPDAHHRAGLACIDCHTGAGLMGLAPVRGDADNTDIACEDCHDSRRTVAMLRDRPAEHRPALRRIPFEATPDQLFLTTGSGTPLWHVEVRDGQLLLHPKLGGAPVSIPAVDPAHVPLADRHGTLSCDACHATWAPQCHGCHLSYDPADEQWDHALRAVTAGAWDERRWGIRNELPPLGWREDGTVGVFVPGMIMTVEHPSWPAPRFTRRFAPLAPHTTGRARRCTECHASPVALGLGAGGLTATAGEWHFEPTGPPLADGLPADAWTSLERAYRTAGDHGPRPFSREEIGRLLEALRPSIREN